MRKITDLTSQRYGKLTVIGLARTERYRTGTRIFWLCRCDCGKEKVIRGDGLHRGDYVSCGCKKIAQLTEHGATGTPEHKAWCNMVERCHTTTHRNYAEYGGRGISVCLEWRSNFQDFIKYVGLRPSPRHSIDRYPNNNGNYEPGNVRWATSKQQQRNMRSNVLDPIKVAEIRNTPKTWGSSTRLAEKFGCSPGAIYHVLRGNTWR